VAFEVGAHYLVFQANGVSIHPSHEFGDHIPEGSWTLSDSDADNKQPCHAFRNAANWKKTWIIQATSPLYERWKEWQKQDNAFFFVMDPFSIDEMAALG
jgi:hypothetical protein